MLDDSPASIAGIVAALVKLPQETERDDFLNHTLANFMEGYLAANPGQPAWHAIVAAGGLMRHVTEAIERRMAKRPSGWDIVIARILLTPVEQRQAAVLREVMDFAKACRVAGRTDDEAIERSRVYKEIIEGELRKVRNTGLMMGPP